MNNDNTALLGPDKLAAFCRDAGLLLAANIPLHVGLADVRDTLSEGSAMHEALSSVVEVMRGGGRLSAALESSGRFPAYMSDLCAIGERTGRLDEIVERMGRYYERVADFKQRIYSAVIYPVVLLGMMAAVVAVLIWSVLPVFSNVLSRFDASAAKSADAVIGASTAVCAVILALLITALIFAAVCLILSKTRGGDAKLRSIFSALPASRKIIYETELCKFSSGLSAMLGSGFTLDEALEALLPSTEDTVLKAKLEGALAAMRAGTTQEDALADAGLYSDDETHLIRVAARAGALDSTMEKLADDGEQRVGDSLERVSSLVEPLLVATLTVIVGAVMLAVMLPLIDIMNAIG